MRKIKSSELANSFSPLEVKMFELYLSSPFFNCSAQVAELFSLYSTKFVWSKEELFRKIYPGKTYDDKLMRYIISDLNKHIENFLMLRQLNKEPLYEKSLMSKALANRECDKAYSHVHHEMVNMKGFRNSEFYLRQFEHAEWHMNYINRKATRKTTPDYAGTLQNLDTFYLIKKLQLACEVTNLANILKKGYDIVLLEEINRAARTKPFIEVPLINIYYHILQTLVNPSDDMHFNLAGKLLKEEGRNIHPSELSELYQYIRNFCVRKINQGDDSYVRRLFNIHVDMLNNKSLMNHDYLSQWEFKNIVTISLRIGEIKWCERFLKNYINHLQPAERKNALAYNTAYFYFMNNEFHKAIRKLQDVELNDVFYQLDSRVVILKSYYELDEFDAFYYQASSFRLFLLRNKGVSEYQKTIYRNLIKFLTAILRANNSVTKLKRIKAEIEKEKNIADINWLLNKVNIAIG